MNHTILDTKYRTSVRLARSSDDQPAPCRGIGVGTSSQSLEVMHRTRRRLGHTSLFCQSLVLRIWNRPVIWNDLCYAYTASENFKTCWGSPLQAHTKGTDAMS